MATTVGQHGVAAFTNPSNGDALDATVVKGNDNTLRDAYVSHDSDGGIHLQSSILASRPSAGTVGRKWLTTDSGDVRLWYDNGSAWEEISYIQSGNASFPSDVAVAGNLTVDGNATVDGDLVLGASSASTIALNGVVSTDIIPSTTNAKTLGSSSLRFANVYSTNMSASGTVSAASLSGSGAGITGVPAAAISAGTLTGSYTMTGTLNANTVTATNNVNATGFNGTYASLGVGLSLSGLVTPAADISGSYTMALNRNVTWYRLTGNTTVTVANSGGYVSSFYFILIKQDGVGGRSLTFTNVGFPGGVTPSVTTTAGKGDLWLITSMNGTDFYGVQLGANF